MLKIWPRNKKKLMDPEKFRVRNKSKGEFDKLMTDFLLIDGLQYYCTSESLSFELAEEQDPLLSVSISKYINQETFGNNLSWAGQRVHIHNNRTPTAELEISGPEGGGGVTKTRDYIIHFPYSSLIEVENIIYDLPGSYHMRWEDAIEIVDSIEAIKKL